jgi:hypothetical protein
MTTNILRGGAASSSSSYASKLDQVKDRVLKKAESAVSTTTIVRVLLRMIHDLDVYLCVNTNTQNHAAAPAPAYYFGWDAGFLL